MTGNLPEIGSDGSINVPTILLDNVDTWLYNFAYTLNETVKDNPEECPKKVLIIGTQSEVDFNCTKLGRENIYYSHELIRDIENNPDFLREHDLNLFKYEFENVIIYFLNEGIIEEEDSILLSQGVDQMSFKLGKLVDSDE